MTIFLKFKIEHYSSRFSHSVSICIETRDSRFSKKGEGRFEGVIAERTEVRIPSGSKFAELAEAAARTATSATILRLFALSTP